jgi:hypothetical protein
VIRNLARNVKANVPSSLLPNVQVEPHLWGDLTFGFAVSKQHAFSRILAADTLWMDWQHDRLLMSMAHFLAKTSDARVLVVAGFHTGRAKVSKFFEAVEKHGLEVASICEVHADGGRRQWSTAKEETAAENRCWTVMSTLKWK